MFDRPIYQAFFIASMFCWLKVAVVRILSHPHPEAAVTYGESVWLGKNRKRRSGSVRMHNWPSWHSLHLSIRFFLSAQAASFVGGRASLYKSRPG